MRLIDADDLKLNRELCTYERYTGIDELPYEYANREIRNAKTVDVNNLIVEELEKIWEEIRALPDINPDYQMDRTIHISRYGVQEIIYNHISELEGEKNK